MQIYDYDAVVVGSGSAGYACAVRLRREGIKRIAVITEGRQIGTSRNGGSDKQTYYKISLAGDGGDSVLSMAETLFAGGGMDGDLALAEAAGSAEAFFGLIGLGVEFPSNEYGEYVGYRTDHDSTQRATSAGPYTSRRMTDALEAEVLKYGIPVYDRCRAIRILTFENAVQGILAVDLQKTRQFMAFRTGNVVLATGGNAFLYRDSVYPYGQTGASFLALEAGARFANLSEWQYGIASVGTRWNLSGSYQQVLPRYVSVDVNGTEREFLCDEFNSDEELWENIFLKGYEWPFDSKKVDGSSKIDLLVYREKKERGRKVYLDFTCNPARFSPEKLTGKAKEYLEKSDAIAPTPVERLKQINYGAYKFFLEHGIDLEISKLEIAVCAQHNNGGIEVDCNWETNLTGLYAVGECAGTHGIYRPGGTALNAGQVGAVRAAKHIAHNLRIPLAFEPIANAAMRELDCLIEKAHSAQSNLSRIQEKVRDVMSDHFAFVRDVAAMRENLAKMDETTAQPVWREEREIPAFLKTRELLAMRKIYAQTIMFSAKRYASRGSALVTENGAILSERKGVGNEIVESYLCGGKIQVTVRKVRPIPQRELWFETVCNRLKQREERE